MTMHFVDILKLIDFQTVLLFSAAILIFKVLQQKKKPSVHLPPGPRGLPIVGNLLSLSLHSEWDMREWSEQYGPVCRVQFGKVEFVLLGSLDAIEEAFIKKKEIFSDRFQNSVFSLTGDTGILFMNNGHVLKEQRRFGISALKMFGMGRRSLEPKIIDLCLDLCEELEKYSQSNEPVDIAFPIYQRVSAVISLLVFNKDIAKESKEFRDILRQIQTGTKYDAISAVSAFYPALKTIPPFSWGEEESKRFFAKMFREVHKQIEEHKVTRDPSEPRDYIDYFLQEIENRKVQSDILVDDQGFKDEQLKGMVRDLFGAGSETTSSTICWTILFLCKNLDCQVKLHQEIDDILQNNRPSTALADQLNYAKAVVQETLRLRPAVPIGIPHVAKTDDTILGYRIKKGTCVVGNLFGIMHDGSIWKNPDMFDPTRHLDENGKFVKNVNAIPFSIGARQCLGMQLANMELFLFTLIIFQKFSFELQPGQNIDMRGKNVFTLRPCPFKVIVKERS